MLFACFLTLVLVLAGTGLYLQHRLSGQIGRIDNAFAGLHDRPSRPAAGDAADAVNILVMSTRRNETVMVVHIDSDRRGASVVSIPHSSWVAIPGRGPDTIDATVDITRPALAVHTVENLTRLRIDHLAVIDWEVFRQLADAHGGVTLDIPKTVHDKARNITWTEGRQKLTGRQALDYADQRDGLPGGELDRIHRQQYFLRTVVDDALHQEFRKRPIQLYRFLDSVTRNLSVDSGWSLGDMRGLAISLRNLRSADIWYLRVPTAGTGRKGDREVVHLDRSGNTGFWRAVRQDHVAEWLTVNPADGIPVPVN